MAVNKVPQATKMLITIQNGMNDKGQPVKRQRSYKNVKVTATDEDVLVIAQAIATLQQHDVLGISRVDEGNLVKA